MEEGNQKRNIFSYSRIAEYFKTRFSLEEDKAHRDEVIASISKGAEFRGVNLWVLIFATMIASLGLNVNSPAVIIGAMLISPIMGPIISSGLALSINDYDLLKKSLRSFARMMIVAMVTSTLYFLISPLSTPGSELLARTTPTAYDVFIALFGGMAGMVAQTRRDKTSTVIPGVAIATALIPPLCTAGFGIATAQPRIFFGALYLFSINSVFIAMAAYIIVRLLKYEHKVAVDKARERRRNIIMAVTTLVVFIPSVVIGVHMINVSVFESKVATYVSHVFNFPQTRVIDKKMTYKVGRTPSQVELMLVGDPLDDQTIENARTQMRDYGLESVELTVRQASHTERMDYVSLNASYVELLEEKNDRIKSMRTRHAEEIDAKNRDIEQLNRELDYYCFRNIDVNDIAREAGKCMSNIGSLSLTKGMEYDTNGAEYDATLICIVRPVNAARGIDRKMLLEWLRIRTKVDNIRLFVDEPLPAEASPAVKESPEAAENGLKQEN